MDNIIDSNQLAQSCGLFEFEIDKAIKLSNLKIDLSSKKPIAESELKKLKQTAVLMKLGLEDIIISMIVQGDITITEYCEKKLSIFEKKRRKLKKMSKKEMLQRNIFEHWMKNIDNIDYEATNAWINNMKKDKTDYEKAFDYAVRFANSKGKKITLQRVLLLLPIVLIAILLKKDNIDKFIYTIVVAAVYFGSGFIYNFLLIKFKNQNKFLAKLITVTIVLLIIVSFLTIYIKNAIEAGDIIIG